MNWLWGLLAATYVNITIRESEAGIDGHVKSILPPENRCAVVAAGATHFFRDA
jgi:hypothetical protein